MMVESRAIIDDLLHYAQLAGTAGLVVSSSGNISVRLDRGRFAISASGAHLGDLSRRDVCVANLDSARKGKGPESSLEEHLHRAIYLERNDIGAVLHFQSPFATLLACSKKPFPDLNFIPEVPVYIRKVKVIPFHPPGDARLTEAVRNAVRDTDCSILLLRNHGQIAIGENLMVMLRNAEFLEFACMIVCGGKALQRFPKKTVQALMRAHKA